LNGSRRTFEQPFHALFPLDEGQPGQVLAVEKQEIENVVHKFGRASLVGRGLHLGKGSRPIGTNRTQLAVDIGSLGGKRGNRLCRRLVSVRPIEARPRQQARLTSDEPRVDAIAIIFE
jgi:hypothetical protein